MQKIIFANNQEPALNDTNLNQLQTNIENAIDLKADISSLSSVATSGSYNDLSNKPTIPTNSSFTLSGLSEKSYTNLTDKPTIPTNSSFTLAGLSEKSYASLTNKPTIPTVNNATLTIQKNGSNVATFTANASSNVTANISVPSLPTVETFTNVVTKTSGGSLTSSTIKKYGNVYQLCIVISSPSSSTSAGSNIFQGTLNANYIPLLACNSSSYNGSSGVSCFLDTEGSITFRVISGSIGANKEITVSFTYIR